MQIYQVRRENDKMYFIKAVDSAVGLTRDQYFEVPNGYDEFAKSIRDNIDSKTVLLDENGNLTFEDEKYYGIPVTDIKRVTAIKKAKLKMESLVQSVDMITYINYIDINNELYNYGIFITEGNREEKYLEILETGDEHKIDLLEELLLAKDKLGVVKSAKQDFDDTFEAVFNIVEDDEALDTILSKI